MESGYWESLERDVDQQLGAKHTSVTSPALETGHYDEHGLAIEDGRLFWGTFYVAGPSIADPGALRQAKRIELEKLEAEAYREQRVRQQLLVLVTWDATEHGGVDAHTFNRIAGAARSLFAR